MKENIQKIIEKFVPKPQVKSCMQMLETELKQPEWCGSTVDGVCDGYTDQSCCNNSQCVCNLYKEPVENKDGELKHWSDCAVHNMPASPNGPCDCGGFKLSKFEDKKKLDALKFCSTVIENICKTNTLEVSVFNNLNEAYCKARKAIRGE